MQLIRAIAARHGHTDLEPPFFMQHTPVSPAFSFFQGIRKKLGNSISFSVGIYHMVAVNSCSVLPSSASHTNSCRKPVSVHPSFHNSHYAIVGMSSRLNDSH